MGRVSNGSPLLMKRKIFMNLEKRYELQKKQIERLQNRVIELERDLSFQEDEFKRTHKLNKELERMKDDWSKELQRLKDMQAEYNVLISQLKIMTKKNK